MMGRGMMGGAWSAQTPAEPISLEEAEKAVDGYLSGVGNADLALKEIMVFDNHAYAEIYEQSTGIGAMEVLVDPLSKAVYPEYGPNMMWNLKYGHMGSRSTASEDNQISLEQAIEYAQDALDNQVSGAVVEDHGLGFYGYYTFDYQIDGKISGMLSVNGNTGNVWIHNWHGQFIEELEVK